MTRKQSAKYYVVRAGRETGIFLTWDECRIQVDKFSGGIYKSFKTLEEAKGFIQNTNTSVISNPSITEETKDKKPSEQKESRIVTPPEEIPF